MDAAQVIRVSLPSATLYVSGTVNGVDVVWTNTEGNVWQANAARAADDIYQVELTIIGSTGSTSTASMTLYYGVLNLITDRTQADVNRVVTLSKKISSGTATEQESREWRDTLKGAYNASDLNRVGAAVEYVAGRLNGYGYTVKVNPRQDWQDTDIPTREDMTTYLANVAELRSALAILSTTPPVPDDMIDLTWQEANAIEQILVDVDDLLTRMSQAWFNSGDLYAGEV